MEIEHAASAGLVKIQDLINDAKCFEAVPKMRWPEGVLCPHREGKHVIKFGRDETQEHRQRYRCKSCGRCFDDLAGTILEGHHLPLRTWILCLYFMGSNLSNTQIARELDLNKDDVQRMTTQLREGIVDRKPAPILDGTVECDEVYVIAGHKGHPSAVRKQHRKGRRSRLKGARGRGTLEKEKPPVFGMMQRGGQVIIRMLENVLQVTIHPLIQASIAPGTLVLTDEYDIYG